MKNIVLISFLFLNSNLCFTQVVNKISVQDARKDLTELVKTIESVHYNPYHRIDKRTFVQIQDSVFKQWDNDSISYSEYTKTGMYLTSLMSNGHTSFDWQNPLLFPELLSSSFLPIKVRLQGNSLIVTSSATQGLKVGSLITSVNDLNAVSLFRDVMSLTGGINTFKEEVSEKLFPLYLFFFLQEQNNYKIKLKSGEEKLVIGTGVQEVIEFIQSDINKEKYTFEVVDNDVGLISYNKCEDNEAFGKFLDSTFQFISSNKIKKLIIDLRYNSGGNSSLNDQLLSYLTRKKYRQSSGRYWKVSKEIQNKIKTDSLWYGFLSPDFLDRYLKAEDQSIINAIDYRKIKNDKPSHFFRGKHCFLIGPYTYSSANYLADAIQTFSLSTLIGQPTGEYTNDFGEQVEFKLPRANSFFFVPTTYDIGANKKETIMNPVIPDVYIEEKALETAIKFLDK